MKVLNCLKSILKINITIKDVEEEQENEIHAIIYKVMKIQTIKEVGKRDSGKAEPQYAYFTIHVRVESVDRLVYLGCRR